MPAEQTGRREEKRLEWPSETQERALEGRAYVFFPPRRFQGLFGASSETPLPPGNWREFFVKSMIL